MIGEKKTQCRCPKCNVIHTKKIFWTGDTAPRIYCESCDGVIKRMTGFIGIHNVRSGKRSQPSPQT